MKKLTDTTIGISVNKSNAKQKFQVRDTVFKKGSELNSDVDFYGKSRPSIGYNANKKRK